MQETEEGFSSSFYEFKVYTFSRKMDNNAPILHKYGPKTDNLVPKIVISKALFHSFLILISIRLGPWLNHNVRMQSQ